MTAAEIHTRPTDFRRFGGTGSRVRVELRGSDRVGVDRLDTIPIAAAPDRGRVVLSLGQALDPDHALPDLDEGDRLEAVAAIELALDRGAGAREDGDPGGGPVGVPYTYSPAVIAGLRLVADRSGGFPGGVVVAGRAARLRFAPGQRRARLLVEDAFRIPPGAGDLDGVRVELVVSASHEDARAGHVLLLGGGPQRRDRDRAGQISVARLRPGGARLPTGDETKQLRSLTLPANRTPRGVYSLPLPGLRRDEQLMVRSCVRASVRGVGRTLPIATRMFLADSPAQAEPDERSYAALIAPAGGRVADGGCGDCQPGGATSFRDVGVVRIRENAVRPVYLNVSAAAGEYGAGGPGDAVELIQGGWLDVVRVAPGEAR